MKRRLQEIRGLRSRRACPWRLRVVFKNSNVGNTSYVGLKTLKRSNVLPICKPSAAEPIVFEEGAGHDVNFGWSLLTTPCVKSSPTGNSRSLSMVIVQESAEPLTTLYSSRDIDSRQRNDQTVSMALMISLPMIMSNKFVHGPT